MGFDAQLQGCFAARDTITTETQELLPPGVGILSGEYARFVCPDVAGDPVET